MGTYYIVWNAALSEGFITDDEFDAQSVKKKKFRGAYTTAGSDFAEAYSDDKLSIQKIEIPTKRHLGNNEATKGSNHGS